MQGINVHGGDDEESSWIFGQGRVRRWFDLLDLHPGPMGQQQRHWGALSSDLIDNRAILTRVHAPKWRSLNSYSIAFFNFLKTKFHVFSFEVRFGLWLRACAKKCVNHQLRVVWILTLPWTWNILFLFFINYNFVQNFRIYVDKQFAQHGELEAESLSDVQSQHHGHRGTSLIPAKVLQEQPQGIERHWGR